MPEAARAPIIEVEGLYQQFGRRRVLDDVNLTIDAGEAVAIVGSSGGGKSTLLRDLALIERPSGGEIRLFGEPVSRLPDSGLMALRRRLGVLFQDGALFGDLTVLENVMVPLREHTRLPLRLQRELAALKIGLTGLDPDVGSRYPDQLSGGMRKRAALARAIALDPELLFLDEPTSGLDPVSADALDRLLIELKTALGLTLVVITHDFEALWELADRVIFISGGGIRAQGPIAELAGSEHPDVAAFFLNAERQQPGRGEWKHG